MSKNQKVIKSDNIDQTKYQLIINSISSNIEAVQLILRSLDENVMVDFVPGQVVMQSVIHTALVEFSSSFAACQVIDELQDQRQSLNIEWQEGATTFHIGNPPYALPQAFQHQYTLYTQNKDTAGSAGVQRAMHEDMDDIPKTLTPMAKEKYDLRKVAKVGLNVLDGWYFDEDTVDQMSELVYFMVGVPQGFNEQMVDQNFRTMKVSQPKHVIFNQNENPHVCRLEFEETGVQEKLVNMDFTLHQPMLCDYKPVLFLPVMSKRTIPEMEYKDYQCLLTGCVPDWDSELLVHELEEYFGDKIVELNPTLGKGKFVVLFKHKRSVEQVSKIKDAGSIKIFGRNLNIKPYTDFPVALTGEQQPINVKQPDESEETGQASKSISIQNQDQIIQWGINKFEFEKIVYPFNYTPQGRPVESNQIKVMSGQVEPVEEIVRLFKKGIVDPHTGEIYFDAKVAAKNSLQVDQDGVIYTDDANKNPQCKFKWFKYKEEIKKEHEGLTMFERRNRNLELLGKGANVQNVEDVNFYSNYNLRWMRNIKVQY